MASYEYYTGLKKNAHLTALRIFTSPTSVFCVLRSPYSGIHIASTSAFCAHCIVFCHRYNEPAVSAFCHRYKKHFCVLRSPYCVLPSLLEAPLRRLRSMLAFCHCYYFVLRLSHCVLPWRIATSAFQCHRYSIETLVRTVRESRHKAKNGCIEELHIILNTRARL